jgi:hypothetical protein
MKKISFFSNFLNHYLFYLSLIELIQHYLSNSSAKSVSNSDFNDWTIQSDGGTTSGIENCCSAAL